MAVYRYDKETKKLVKISERSFRSPGSAMERPFHEQVMEGYRKCEEQGMRINGRPAGIKRIWGN